MTALQTQNDPATAPTVPGLGSQHPAKDIEMNEARSTTAQAVNPSLSRRGFMGLTGTVAVAGTGAALMAFSVATAPAEMTTEERAEFHWNAFVEAMDELTVDYDGWMASGLSRVSSKTGDRFSQLRLDSIRMMPERIGSAVVNIERHSPLALKAGAVA